MKKLFAILLALAMIFAMSATVFAADEGKTDVTIKDGRTYTAHMLMSVTTSLKNENDGCTTHNANCYNYAYTVNPDYLDYWEEVDETLTTEQAIIEYLGADGTDMRTVADELYLAIDKDEDAPAGTPVTGTAKMDQGYWLFVDETVPGDKVKSPVIVNTVGQDALEINPKVGTPSVEKKVLDDAAWHDSADYEIGDTVTFQLTATTPSNLADWATYKMVFHDALSDGLTLNADSFAATVDGQTVTNPFTYTAGEDGAFTLSCANVKNIPNIAANSVIVITYTATLDEDAVIGGDGNPNTVRLEYSNNPYDTTTNMTTPDKVVVFTYQLIINKVDGSANGKPALKGAGFTLWKKNGATYEKVAVDETAEGEKIYELKGTDLTTFVWEGLDAGEYKLEESTVPAGYNKMDDIEFVITATRDVESADPKLTALNGGALDATADFAAGSLTKTIENNTGTVLPSTGAQGTFMLITGGTLLVVLAAVFMITRKKMSIYED